MGRGSVKQFQGALIFFNRGNRGKVERERVCNSRSVPGMLSCALFL